MAYAGLNSFKETFGADGVIVWEAPNGLVSFTVCVVRDNGNIEAFSFMFPGTTTLINMPAAPFEPMSIGGVYAVDGDTNWRFEGMMGRHLIISFAVDSESNYDGGSS